MSNAKCPKCQFHAPQPITDKKDRFYCPKCKNVWVIGKEKESLEDSGSLEFNGIMPAKKLIEMVSKNAKLPAEAKAAFLAQFTGAMFEQWYEGFKSGLIADIIHQKDLHDNGKTRTEQGDADREHRTGNSETGNQDDENSIGGQPVGATPESFSRVKEQLAGVELTRPSNIQPTDAQYEGLAKLISTCIDNKINISKIDFDGVHANIQCKP